MIVHPLNAPAAMLVRLLEISIAPLQQAEEGLLLEMHPVVTSSGLDTKVGCPVGCPVG